MDWKLTEKTLKDLGTRLDQVPKEPVSYLDRQITIPRSITNMPGIYSDPSDRHLAAQIQTPERVLHVLISTVRPRSNDPETSSPRPTPSGGARTHHAAAAMTGTPISRASTLRIYPKSATHSRGQGEHDRTSLPTVWTERRPDHGTARSRGGVLSWWEIPGFCSQTPLGETSRNNNATYGRTQAWPRGQSGGAFTIPPPVVTCLLAGKGKRPPVRERYPELTMRVDLVTRGSREDWRGSRGK
jgi:hypothetical protein